MFRLLVQQTRPSAQRLILRHMSKKTVTVNFINTEGAVAKVQAEVGRNFLEVAHANNIDLEGACDGTLACSTCHIIFSKSVFDKLPAPVEEELDMLDLATDLTETSRLGCQVIVTEEMDNIRVKLPAAVADVRPGKAKPPTA